MDHSNQISVLDPLVIGVATTFCTVFVHGLILALIIAEARRDLRRGRIGVGLWGDLAFVTSATLLALVGHLVEIALWALTFVVCGEFPNFAAALYQSAVNYTTLGDSTALVSARWKLLRPLEASDGMLMFGVSTAMIFAVAQRLMQTRFGRSES